MSANPRMSANRFERLVRAAAGRPIVTLAVVLALALAGGALALGLRPSAGSDTFVSRSSPSFQATDDAHHHFGGDAVVILIREPLTDLVETGDLGVVSQLEACLAGQQLVRNRSAGAYTTAPPGGTPYGGWRSPCGELARARTVQVVYGPGTFLNRAILAVNAQIASLGANVRRQVQSAEQSAYQLALARGFSRKQALAAANAAGLLELQQQEEQLAQLALQSGISGFEHIDDEQFISQIVFDPLRGVNQPKARFAYLFPTSDSALIQVRLKASISDAEQARTISWIRQAVRMPMFRLGFGGSYTVSGVPVVVHDLASELTGSIAGLLIAAVVVMGLMLLIVFRSRLRLLPLAIALAAAGITFGVTAIAGAPLTMASIAVLPILIGLAVDYTIQFQSRVQEAQGESLEAATVARAAAHGVPTIATAALATATGFLVLLLSPVPMVRGFGLLLVIGIAIALGCAVSAGSAAMVVRRSRVGGSSSGGLPGRGGGGSPFSRLPGRSGGILVASVRGAADILGDVRDGVRAGLPRRPGSGARVLSRAIAVPWLVIAVGLVLAVLGWVADTQTSVQSDVTKLVPSSMPALRDLHLLERVTGVSGEIDLVVRSKDIATPATIGWMVDYENKLLTHYGYLETKGCEHATLCPALSLPDLFSTGSSSAPSAGALTSASIAGLLAAVPTYFSQAVITPDHREATLAFGIRLMPLSRQQRVIDYMRSQLHPPPGVTARLAGLPVLAAEANNALSSSARRLLTVLAGLIAVGLVLLAVFRSARRALIPLIPIVLATGWSALILFLIGIPLNPMSAALGALVIAISTEFSVLLSERFRQERRAGYALDQALARTYHYTGAAVLASGITAIGGFGVLVFSSIRMLRDFGFVTVVDLSVSLVGVLLVLPAVLALSEPDDVFERVETVPRDTVEPLPRARVA